MGRRKIEIQPITHERNRSVTFLKRKNGLFKKAYELGVLCSVDVAVIIFEERTGQPKLFQYCSSNIDELVTRQQRHEGERDTRGPADFAGNSNTKNEDEDDLDDDEEILRRPKRNNDGRLKQEGGFDLPVNSNLAYLRPHRPLLLQGTGHSGTTGTISNLPLSSDRHSPTHGENHSKKPRIMPGGIRIPSHSRTSDEIAQHSASASSSSPGYEYQSPASSTFRHPVTSPHQASPPSFIPSFESFSGPPRPQPPPSRASGTFTPRSSSADTAIYNNSMRQSHNSASGTGGGGIFNFLDNEHPQNRTQSSSGDYSNMDWPVHSTGYSSSTEHSGRRVT